jgi:perosamine synthetase
MVHGCENSDLKVIPKARPYMGLEEIEQVAQVLRSGWISNGPKTRELENAIALYLGLVKEQVIVVTNCTSALHVSLLSSGVTAGDEVLVADFTFPATGHAVMYCGAVPRFVDIDPATFNIDPSKLEEKINERTKAIIPVHTFGQPAEMDEIIRIATKNGLSVIEDAACAFGAQYRGQMVGTIGDFGCYSFHALKGITCGEGGAIIAKDRNMADKARRLCNYGIEPAWDRHTNVSVPVFQNLGYNYKISDIQSAVVLAQLRKMSTFIEKRRELAKIWCQELSPLVAKGYLREQASPIHTTHSHQSQVIVLEESINRNLIMKTMREKFGVETTLGTYSSHVQPVYHSNDKCPVAKMTSDQSLSLPFYFELTEDIIKYCAASLSESIKIVKRCE